MLRRSGRALLAFVALVAIPNGVAGLIGLATGDKRVAFQPLAALPLGVMVLDWIWALIDIIGLTKMRPRIKIDAPTPPVEGKF